MVKRVGGVVFFLVFEGSGRFARSPHPMKTFSFMPPCG